MMLRKLDMRPPVNSRAASIKSTAYISINNKNPITKIGRAIKAIIPINIERRLEMKA